MKNTAETFVKTTDVAFEILSKFGGNVMGVYLVILKHRNRVTNKCFPSIATISAESNIGDKTVKKIIGQLYDNGYLNINSGTRGTANNYYFPKESFYDDFDNDTDQLCAKRKKKPFLKKNIKPIKHDFWDENEEENEDEESFVYPF